MTFASSEYFFFVRHGIRSDADYDSTRVVVVVVVVVVVAAESVTTSKFAGNANVTRDSELVDNVV